MSATAEKTDGATLIAQEDILASPVFKGVPDSAGPEHG
jgi:hypothetical protein